MTTKPEVRLNITKGPAFTQAANAVSLCVNASLDFNEFRDDVKLQLKEENFSATIGLERSHVLVIGKDGKIIKNKHGFANLLATSPEEIVVEIAEYATAGGESNGHFFRLFSEVILQGKMDCTTDPDIWTLTGEESWGEDEVYSLLIRKDWIKLRESILDESRHFPLCLLLKGKSGRGKSVFLKYLIFFILYEAKNREKCGVYSENESHLYAPLIVYVGRDNKTHYISLEGVFTEWIWHRRNHGKPHYYFSDNVDILSGATMGTRVTMALTSGDAIVMNEFSKRIDDVGGTVAYMPSLTLGEMLKLFATPQQPPQHPPQQSLQHPPQQSPQQPPQQSLQHPAQQSLQHPPQQSPQQPLQQKTEQVPSDFTQAGTASVQKLRRHQYTAEEVQFRFDVIGGNPRRMKDKIFSVARTTHYYKLVSSVVDKVFPDQTAARKRWALNLVCAVLEGAQIIGGKTQTDSSLFREYVVSGAAFTEHEEVFCSTFLGMVAATIEAHKDALKELSILTLFGASGYGNLFEYQMHQALLAASPEDEYFCWCSDGKNHVSLRLGGGNVKLVRTINDLTTLTVGSYAMPTIPNYAIVDSVRVTEHTLTTGWLFRHRSVTTTRKIGINATIGDRHDGKVTKLPALLEALGTTEDNFWIVYVLPLNTIHTFKFPTNLGAVKLFVTASHPTTEAAMRGAMTSRKRKLSWW